MSLPSLKRKPTQQSIENAKRNAGLAGTGMRVPIESLMKVIHADREMQESLDSSAWDRLDTIRVGYDMGTIDRRGLVDGFSEVVGGTLKLFAMVKTALKSNAEEDKQTNSLQDSDGSATTDPAASVQRVALQRISSIASSSSSASTPGGNEVASILSGPPHRLPRSRVAPPPSASPAVNSLVHSFHCEDANCDEPKCHELKLVLERMEGHIEQCPIGVTPLGECKTCRLWKTLARTRSHARSASTQPQYSPSLMDAFR